MNRINLLPEREQPGRRVTPMKFLIIVALELATVSASALYAYRYFSIKQMEAETAAIAAQIAVMKPDIDMISKVQSRTDELKQYVEEADAIMAEGLAAGKILREVRSTIPADVWLSSLSIEPNGGLGMEGATLSMESVARVALAFEDSPLFHDVHVGSIDLAGAGGRQVYDFSLACALEPGR